MTDTDPWGHVSSADPWNLQGGLSMLDRAEEKQKRQALVHTAAALAGGFLGHALTQGYCAALPAVLVPAWEWTGADPTSTCWSALAALMVLLSLMLGRAWGTQALSKPPQEGRGGRAWGVSGREP